MKLSSKLIFKKFLQILYKSFKSNPLTILHLIFKNYFHKNNLLSQIFDLNLDSYDTFNIPKITRGIHFLIQSEEINASINGP